MYSCILHIKVAGKGGLDLLVKKKTHLTFFFCTHVKPSFYNYSSVIYHNTLIYLKVHNYFILHILNVLIIYLFPSSISKYRANLLNLLLTNIFTEHNITTFKLYTLRITNYTIYNYFLSYPHIIIIDYNIKGRS